MIQLQKSCHYMFEHISAFVLHSPKLILWRKYYYLATICQDEFCFLFHCTAFCIALQMLYGR